jgi:argininosuccinate lyase
MPQKRNPDGAELARASGGALLGLLTGFLATMKGLPSGYQKDLQEDKRALFEAHDRLVGVLEVLAGTIGSMTLDPERALGAMDPSVLASDVAERLACGGVPFRIAHDTVARLVQHAEERGISLSELTPDEVGEIEPTLAADWQSLFDREAALQRRGSTGGSSAVAVNNQICEARRKLDGA